MSDSELETKPPPEGDAPPAPPEGDAPPAPPEGDPPPPEPEAAKPPPGDPPPATGAAAPEKKGRGGGGAKPPATGAAAPEKKGRGGGGAKPPADATAPVSDPSLAKPTLSQAQVDTLQAMADHRYGLYKHGAGYGVDRHEYDAEVVDGLIALELAWFDASGGNEGSVKVTGKGLMRLKEQRR